MAEFKKVITNKGQELITASALDSGELAVKYIVIGDANGESYEPTAEQTVLVNQRNKLLITERIVNSPISYTFFVQIPQNIDYYIIREIGLLDENDNLIEIAQMKQETYIQSDNLVQQLTIGIQIDVGQSNTVIVLADTNIETASKNFVNDNFQKLSEKNQANGYAGLDENGKLPLNKLSSTNLSDFTDNLGSNPVHTHNQYLTSHQSLAGYANTDLSNLTATGKNNLIHLAHILDWESLITVSTTIDSTDKQSYTCPDYGAILLYVAAAGGTASKSIGCSFSLNGANDLNYPVGGGRISGITANTTFSMSTLHYFSKNEVADFYLWALNGTTNTGYAVFIPFKKDLN